MSVWNGVVIASLKVVYDPEMFKRIVTGEGDEGEPSEPELAADQVMLDQPAFPDENLAELVAY